MIRITSHQLARKLLEISDRPIVIDGIGEDVGLAYYPQIGHTSGGKLDRSDEVVVLEIITRKRFEQEEASRLYDKSFPEKW